MNKELIKKARQTDLASYLISAGVPLKRNGSRYRHKEHDSLVFTKNAYYWNSRGEHGNAIDYLVNHMNMGFIEAVLALIPFAEVKPPNATPASNRFEMKQETLNPNCNKAKSYLRQIRLISNGIIDYLTKENLLYQERQTNNAIFIMRDENNIPVGAELQGVTAKRFKGIMANSKYGHGFNVRFSDNNTYDYALFFESAIDLISFMDYKLNHEKKSLKRCILISMAGLKLNVVKHYSKMLKGAKVVLCIDNDKAGQIFKDKLSKERIHYSECQPDKEYKDWNEQLSDIKKHSKPVKRLLKRSAEDSYMEPHMLIK